MPRSQAPDRPESTVPARRAGGARAFAAMLQVWADTGYGLWTLQGTALAFGVARTGRGESLVPLTLGALFISAGLLVACLRRPGIPAWHGWYPGRGRWPTSAALVALAGYLPMLAVAGLTRGDNAFWATRLAGAVLMFSSVGNLLYSAGSTQQRLQRVVRSSAMLPLGKLIGAFYGGGLWLWLCFAADDRALPNGDALQQPWLLLLLMMALLLGLIEGMRWHALRAPGLAPAEVRGWGLSGARFIAALATYAVPCAALLVADRWQTGGLFALVAALSCVIGRSLEQRLYEQVAARCVRQWSGD